MTERPEPENLAATVYRAVFELSPLAAIAADAQGRVIQWSPAAEALLGWTAEEITGRPVAELLPPDRVEEFETNLAHALRGVTRPGISTVRIRKDGTPVDVVLTPVGPLRTAEGEAFGLLVVMEDISPRLAIERELRASEQRFHKIFDNSGDAIFILDPDADEFLDVSPSASRMLGYDRSQLLAMRPSDVHPTEMEQLREFIAGVRETGRGWTDELTCLTSGGLRLPCEMSATSLELDDREWLIAIVRDISVRKGVEAERERIVARLATANEELERFASAVSHELAEPLRTMTVYLQLLERQAHGALGRQELDYIDAAVGGARRMRRLIDDLLAYARAGVTEDPPIDIDCAEVVADVLEAFHGSILESGAQVTIGALPTIAWHRTQAEQLFRNLLSNALKFSRDREPPRVEVGSERRTGEWLFSVIDNGIGMQTAQIERVFGMFERLHAPDAYPGTGIGLAICRQIVERRGGEIWAESRSGEGTSVYFTIPDFTPG